MYGKEYKFDVLIDEDFKNIKDVLCFDNKPNHMILLRTSDKNIDLTFSLSELKFASRLNKEVNIPTELKDSLKECLIYTSSYLLANNELGISGFVNDLMTRNSNIPTILLSAINGFIKHPDILYIFSDRTEMKELSNNGYLNKLFQKYDTVIVCNSDEKIYENQNKKPDTFFDIMTSLTKNMNMNTNLNNFKLSSDYILNKNLDDNLSDNLSTSSDNSSILNVD